MKALFLPTLLLLLACNNTGSPADTNGSRSTDTSDTTQTAPATKTDVSGCYLRALQRDTFALHLRHNGHAVTGRLSFDNFEKDGSTGTVVGSVDGDVVKLTYTFQSEGTESVTDVYFKTTEEGLVQGIGDMTGNGHFANESGIAYPPENLLRKIDCSNLPEKYK